MLMNLLVVACSAAVCLAQEGADSAQLGIRGATAGHREIVDDPPAAASVDGPSESLRPTVVERDGYVSVQVNLGPAGGNVVGDAANEPSIAVDPNAPLRMAVGWRQFDSISSNFREAGWSFSADGGRSWAPGGVLEDGVFRSDPVLASSADGVFYYYSLFGTDTTPREISCDTFISEDWGENWIGPIDAFGGDKAWFAVDRTALPTRGNLYFSWAQISNQYGDRTFIRSFDDGFSYTEPIATLPTPTWGTLTVDHDGQLFIVGNANYISELFVVYRSSNASDPAVEPPRFDVAIADLGGSQLTGGNYPQATPNPRGLLGQIWIDAMLGPGPRQGELYLVASVDPPGADPLDVHFVRSSDGGETWTDPVRIHPDDNGAWQWFATMSVAPTGRIDVVWVESLDPDRPNIGELRYTASHNGGERWTDPVAVSPVFDSWLGWPNQNKLGDYYHMLSDAVGADLIYAATYNGEQDVYYLRIGDTDCNANGIGDSQDLADGLNDCNDNEILDSCEIAAGTAIDADGDGFIDACRLPPRRGDRRLSP
jgi:hypothetical protein